MKRIQKLIPTAIDVADEKLKDGAGINREVNGYISSLGASIISAGLLPSIVFYSQKGDSAKERHKIIECIEGILRKHGYSENFKLLEKTKELFTGNNNAAAINKLTNDIFNAAIALKLAIRTFPKSSKE